jgi:periodic tryptophan protein 1
MEQGETAIAIDAESDDEDAEDDEIRDTDALLVVAMTDDEFSHLEVHVYADDGNLYVHHDISLPGYYFSVILTWYGYYQLNK